MDSLVFYVTIFFIITTSLSVLLALRPYNKSHSCPFCGNKFENNITTCDKCIGI